MQTDWLEAHLVDPNLRIFDCTTHLRPAALGSDLPYLIVSGRAEYDAGHIHGAGFLDIQGELSDEAKLTRTRPLGFRRMQELVLLIWQHHEWFQRSAASRDRARRGDEIRVWTEELRRM